MATRPRLTPLRDAAQPKLRHLRRERLRLADGARTTLYVARYDLRRFEARVVRLPQPAPLEAFCRANGFDEALVGGFYERPDLIPLGELRTGGVARRHVPFAEPFGAIRAAIAIDGANVAIARRDELPDAAARRPDAGRAAAGPRRRRGPAATTRASARARTSSTPTSPPSATRARRSGSRAAASCSRSPATGAPTTRPGC